VQLHVCSFQTLVEKWLSMTGEMTSFFVMKDMKGLVQRVGNLCHCGIVTPNILVIVDTRVIFHPIYDIKDHQR